MITAEKTNKPLYLFIKSILLSAILVRTALFLFTWWILSEGDVSSWWIGLPAVILSTIVSLTLLPPTYIASTKLIAFIPLFLIYSFKGALDVALRAIHPRLPINPDIVKYSLNLPSGLAPVFMANLVNLISGTLSVHLEDNVLTIHVIDIRHDFKTELIKLEQHVAKIFVSPQNFSKGDNYNETI